MIIKFNAWDKEDKIMLLWNELCMDDQLLADIILNNTRYIHLQYSNRNDFIDQELYVGDIIKATDNEDSETIGEVIFEKYSFCIEWDVKSKWNTDPMEQVNWNDLDFIIEKVGNIYEGLKIDL